MRLYAFCTRIPHMTMRLYAFCTRSYTSHDHIIVYLCL